MKTYTLKTADIEHRWWLVDATDQPLGRLASRIAQILRGKHKPTFTPYVNGGDFVIVINAEKVQLTGRKVGIASVYLTPGSGKWSINGRTLGDYFPRPSLVSHIQQPFTATDTLGAFDVKARVVGGGLTGQAGAMRLGIARALVLADDRHRKKLREQGLLTRDPRAVERKKPGRAGARKRFQFSKR